MKPLFPCCFFFSIIFSLLNYSAAQNATTDPSEVRALRSIFREWNAEAVSLWNISGEPCSGSAIDGSEFERSENNPAIACDCSFDNFTTCHITKLRVFALNKRGVFPEDMTKLKFLTFLKIDQNFFTGLLPSYIGNMSALQLLSIAHNMFSGPIPKELGNLKDLNLLSISSNSFTGTLPPELGNLVKLEQVYMNSCGLRGGIPSTFANFQNMMRIWRSSDNRFTGKIPSFIGNWTKLTSLRFQGNNFEGPIPSSLSQLTSLKSLRISDIYNGSSSLDFIQNLKNLTDLTLRNALISGSIPTYIREFTFLETLDLSFNNLTGQLPSPLFTLSSLTSLFLGNNSFHGNLPTRKSDKLQTIDLSYNFLSGRFPSWVSSASQLNLVANNFTFGATNTTDSRRLNCLQRNFPCNRNAPRYANFSIKCGGREMIGSNGIVYEAENSTLGPATFHVTSTEKWAVSNVGMFNERLGPSYVQNTLAQALGTNSPELFQTSRMSSGSLRYYGLGLENGPYTVTLQFSETGYEDPSSQVWQSIGRRVFNIYMQGRLERKDFDIAKEAGGVQRAIARRFNVTVSENYLEVHLFWAGKGTCCVPVQGYYGPLIATLHAVSDFPPTVSGIPASTRGDDKKAQTWLIIGVVVPVAVVFLMLVSLAALYMRRKSDNDEDEEEILGLDSRVNTFSYAELKAATDDFNPSNKLGEGGFGSVYKGKIADGRDVAVKKLSKSSNQGKKQFVNEIAAISAVRHRNLVRLYGCCIEGNRRAVVYEYLENRSLDKALFGNSNLHLDWPTRFNICSETAKVLSYLHEETSPRIVHRDVKASNILLDASLGAKISDFGLAKLYDTDKTHISTRVAGTIGYLAPEYAMRGHLTEKVDVFSFGIVALEIVSGRPNSNDSLEDEKAYLLEWAWNLHEKSTSLELVDPTLTSFDKHEASRVIKVALLCTQAPPMARPPMSRVVAMLAGDAEIGCVVSKPSYLTDLDFKDVTSCFSTEDLNTPSIASNIQGKNDKPNEADESVIMSPGSGVLPLSPSPEHVSDSIICDVLEAGR